MGFLNPLTLLSLTRSDQPLNTRLKEQKLLMNLVMWRPLEA